MKKFNSKMPKSITSFLIATYLIPLVIDTPDGAWEFIWFVYLFPPLFVAYYYGLKGGLISGTLAVLLQAFWELRLYLIFEEFEATNFIQLIVTAFTLFAVALGVGLLADRLHKNQSKLEKVNEELRSTYQEMEYMAFHDMLTGLPNRKLFESLFTKAISEAKNNDKLVAMMYVDLDRFKHVNDTMGHSSGDQLVKKVADRLKLCVRQGDIVARLGGDEFTIVINNISSYKDIVGEANKIHSCLQETFCLGDNQLLITSSIGVSIYPTDSTDHHTLMKYADLAMYRAKDSGRNAIQFYKPEMSEEIERRDLLEKLMRKALDFQQFTIYYQPQIHAITKKVVGMEALLRWNHPDLGQVPPNEFISIAEETGLINELGKWVLKTACQQTREWCLNFGIPLKLSVNVSAIQLRNSSFLDFVKQILKDTNLDPSTLVLEVTERVTVHGLEGVIATISELKNLGVKIAVDDFGTEYSSLSYLNKLPVDIIKIDRTFIQDMSANHSEKVLVDAIITVARELKLETIAEGVETLEELEYLSKKGCHIIQGYYFSRPLPGEEFIRFVDKSYYTKESTVL